MRKLQDPAGTLKEIVSAGLPQSGLRLYVAKQYTRLLAPHGRTGVGLGAKRELYQLLDAHADAKVIERARSGVLCMSVEEVGNGVDCKGESDELTRQSWLTSQPWSQSPGNSAFKAWDTRIMEAIWVHLPTWTTNESGHDLRI